MTNELTTLDPNKIATMDEDKALIVIRTNPKAFPHFYTYSQEEKLTMIRAIMLKCYQLRHIKDLSFLDYDSQDLVNMIDKDKRHRDMSFEEIKTAMTNGAVDKYGECKGLTVAFFIKCLNSYIEKNRDSYRKSAEINDRLVKSQVVSIAQSARYMAALDSAANEMMENLKKISR